MDGADQQCSGWILSSVSEVVRLRPLTVTRLGSAPTSRDENEVLRRSWRWLSVGLHVKRFVSQDWYTAAGRHESWAWRCQKCQADVERSARSGSGRLENPVFPQGLFSCRKVPPQRALCVVNTRVWEQPDCSKGLCCCCRKTFGGLQHCFGV